MKLYAPYCAVYASCLVSAGSLVMLSAALQPSILVMVLPDCGEELVSYRSLNVAPMTTSMS